MANYIQDYPSFYKRKKASGLCLSCGLPKAEGSASYCEKHKIFHMEYQRKRAEERKRLREIKKQQKGTMYAASLKA